MDLVQTIRKEGSRGGRGEFKWDDVKNSSHRENYLGHSLMAPVGRWQKNKDLSWYSKAENGQEMSEEDARKAEIKKVKEAEEDALARALGRPLPQRASENANLTALGGGNRVSKAIEEAVGENDQENAGKGIGFGSYTGGKDSGGKDADVLPGSARNDDSRPARRERDDNRKERRRDRSREKDVRREHRHHHRRHRDDDDGRRRRRDEPRSRSRSQDRYRRRSRSRERRRERDYDDRRRSPNDRERSSRHDRARDRSRSPYERREREKYHK